MSEQVQIEILTEIRQAQNNLKNLIRNFAGVSAAVYSVVKLGGEMLDAWMEQERASAKLASALRATGQAANINQKALEDLASELQKVTTYGDETTTSAMAMLQQLGNLTEQGLLKITPAVQDFASAMGIDLNQAASLIGKTLGSSTNALSRYGIQLQDGLSKEEKFVALTQQLNDKFGGMAKAMAETTEGGLKRFQNAIGELLEIGGELISRVLNPVVSQMSKWLTDLNSLIVGVENYNKAVKKGGNADYVKALEEVNKKISEQEAAMMKLNMANSRAPAVIQAKMLYQQLLAQKSAIEANQKAAEKEAAARKGVTDATNEYTNEAKRTAEVSLEWFELLQMQEDAMAGLSAEMNAGVAPALKTVVGGYDEAIIATDALIYRTEELGAAQKKAKEEGEAWANSVSEYFTPAMQTAFSGLGEALVTGGNLWESFGKAAREAIAKLLDSIGQYLAVEAIKNLIPVPFLFNPAGAAGAAAGSAAAFTAAGAIRALPTGGEFTTNGPQLMMVGDNPGGQERVSVTPTAGGGSGGDQVIHNTLVLDGNVLAEWFTKASRNKRALTYAGAVI